MTESSDQFDTLMMRVRLGDEDALEQLVQRYEPEIRLTARVLLRPLLRPYLDSVDLVQSVHRSLMLGLRQNKFDISSPEKLIGLALTLVRRKVARQWRHLQRQKRLSGCPADSGNVPQLLASLSSSEPDPARAAQLRDAMEHL